MSSTLQIKPYIPIPEEIKVPINQMDKVLDSFPETYGVMWTSGTLHRTRPDTAPIKRKRFLLHSWYKTFYCHRSGKKEIHKKKKSVMTGQRPNQKESKKIGCLATMKITCFKNDLENVVFSFKNVHNHAVGTKEDFCLLPVSKTTKDFITKKLEEGCDRKEVQRLLNVSLGIVSGKSECTVIHRDQIMDQNIIYNQYMKLKDSTL